MFESQFKKIYEDSRSNIFQARDSDSNVVTVNHFSIQYIEKCTENFKKPFGSGGSSNVYLAKDTVNPNVTFVVKRIIASGIDEKKIELFRQELEVNISLLKI